MAFIVQSRLLTVAYEVVHGLASTDLASYSNQMDLLSVLYMLNSYLFLRSFVLTFPSAQNAPSLTSAGLAMTYHCDSSHLISAKLSQTTHPNNFFRINCLFSSIYHSLKIYVFICISIHASHLLWSKLHESRTLSFFFSTMSSVSRFVPGQNEYLKMNWINE